MSEDEVKADRANRLAEQLEVKDAIINGISDALMLLDAKTYEILEVNRAFLASYGHEREEVLGKKCYEITHHLASPCHQAQVHSDCPLENSASSGTLSLTEHVHQDSYGQEIFSEIITYPLKDASGQVTRIIHLSRDITEKKHMQSQLLEKEKLNGILELAGAASHEINQPLTVIISGLEQLVKRLEIDNSEYELAELILENAKRLTEISLKLAQITRYASTEYVSGSKIVDLDKASSQESET